MVTFEEFYNNWYEKVYRYLLRHVTDPGTAEDLAGDVFVACYKSYESYDETKTSPSTWLFVMANNLQKYYNLEL